MSTAATTVSAAWATRRIRLPLPLRIVFLLGPLLPMPLLPGEFAAPDGSPWALLAVAAVMAVCMWPFLPAYHRLEVDGSSLTLVYWPLSRHRVEFDDVESVEWRPSISISQSGGLGLVLGRGGVLTLVNRSGPGMLLCTADGRQLLIVLADEEEATQMRRRIEGHAPHVRHTDR